MRIPPSCSSCGAPLFWNGACDQWQHKETWRDRDHFPACHENEGSSMADARLGSIWRG